MISKAMAAAKKVMSLLVEIRERLIHIEEKINRANVKAPCDGEVDLLEHPDQWFGGRTYSQHGEDLVILSIFRRLGIEKPSYLDIGAHHPRNISNTYLIYRRGGRGINVEANPNLVDAFNEERPEDVNLNVGISDRQGAMKFYMIDEWSGRNTFDEIVARKFVENNPQFAISKVMDIPVTTINDVIEKHANGVFPDFLSVDVEGMDERILRSMDLSRSRPKVVCVETVDTDNQDIESLQGFMQSMSFSALIKMGANTIFMDDEYVGRVR